MDEFLKDIYIEIYKKWILYQRYDNIKIYLVNDHCINIDSNYVIGTVRFHDLGIIELIVERKLDNKIELYLHFQMANLKHAVELFNDLIQTIQKIVLKPQVRILLCCSGGLTTGYFAQKINDVSELMDFCYEANALPYTSVYKEADEYDVILLAPQISYMLPEMSKLLDNKIIMAIPPKIFGSYNVASLFTLIEDKINKNNNNVQSLTSNNTNEETILSIAIIRSIKHIIIDYRVYCLDNILLYNSIIKDRINMSDITNTIDTIITLYPNIEKIGFSSPGVIEDDIIRSPDINGLDDVNLRLLKNKYTQDIIVENDANAATLGFHYSLEKKEDTSLIFMPQGLDCGVGTIINNKLIKGYKKFAGEVKFLPHNYKYKILGNHHQDEIIRHLSMSIACICCVIAPTIIAINSRSVSNVDALRTEINKYIPEEYIPKLELVSLNEFRNYTLKGLMIACRNIY